MKTKIILSVVLLVGMARAGAFDEIQATINQATRMIAVLSAERDEYGATLIEIERSGDPQATAIILKHLPKLEALEKKQNAIAKEGQGKR